MRAVVRHGYGSPDVLRPEEVDRTYELGGGHARGKIIVTT
jgi:hypothetical protein